MTTDFHTPIATNAPANASTFNSPMGQLDNALGVINTALNDLISGATTQIVLENSGGYQISSGSIAITDEIFIMIASETGSSDDLDNISTSTDNSLLFIKPLPGHTITVTDAGNISNTPVVLDDTMAALLLFENSQWTLIGPNSSSGGSSFTPSIAILRDEKASGTNGGGCAATTWNARDLNTEVSDADNIVSISSNQFTPVSGTYILKASAPAFKSDRNRLRLFNVTSAVSVEEGPVVHTAAADAVTTNALLNVIFTANGTDAYRIDHYTTAAQATNGLGVANSDGSNEVYLEIVLETIA